jgi:alkylresorcinol/alkylpyrone synthase
MPPRLTALATALPPHIVRQADVRAAAAAVFGDLLARDDGRLLAVFDSTGIEERHFCVPLEWFATPRGFAEANACYVEKGLELVETAARRLLDRAALRPQDVDHVVFVSSTGLSTPSLDARLANRLPLRGDVSRTPIWGLGCAGGAAGLARARDLALAHPDSRVLLLSLELCSLTFQRRDLDLRNFVATSLFSDGAAAALVCGERVEGAAGGPPLELLATRSTLWPDTLDVMGWGVDGEGLHVVFSRDIPAIVRERARPCLEGFLADHGLTVKRLDHLIAHPGGPKVLAAYAEALGLPLATFRHASEVLRTCGNMSSPTCLFVLERTLEAGDVRPGDTAVLTALGPGFASEIVLMRGAAA